MIRRQPQSLNPTNPTLQRPQKHPSPSSTDESADESLQFRGKQKSQLCKRFMENGYCPYEKRCKFAHGSHQLRKNDQLNSKYKTKECGSFKNHLFCPYGDRCNFIHVSSQPLSKRVRGAERDPCLDVEMEIIRSLNIKSSRLLGKLL